MIKVSKLIEQLQGYMEMYGDNSVSVYNRDTNEDLEIVTFDALANEFNIEVGYIREDDEEV